MFSTYHTANSDPYGNPFQLGPNSRKRFALVRVF
jgi:hypothetical protein